MLTFDPNQRVTATEALLHDYFLKEDPLPLAPECVQNVSEIVGFADLESIVCQCWKGNGMSWRQNEPKRKESMKRNSSQLLLYRRDAKQLDQIRSDYRSY